MRTEISLSGAPPADAIGYVTLNFRDLQGLGWAVMWGAVLLFGLLPTPWIHRPGHAILLLVAAISIAALSLVFIPRWYRDRYGFLAPSKTPQYHNSLIKIVIFAFFAILSVSMFFSNGAQLKEILTSGGLMLSMSLSFAMRACEKIPPVLSIQVRRVLSLMVVATAIAGFLRIFLGNGPSNRPLLPMIAAMFVAYLYDHWLLQHLLRRNRSPETLHV